MKALRKKLKKQGLAVHKVPPDGNCLYNSIVHQLRLSGEEVRGCDCGSAFKCYVSYVSGVSQMSLADMRKLVADYMRQHKDEFSPFLEYKAEDNAESDPDGKVPGSTPSEPATLMIGCCCCC